MSYSVSTNYHIQTPVSDRPQEWTARRNFSATAPKPAPQIVTRRCDVEWLDSDGQRRHESVVVPALPIFEDAFSAFAQGTLIQTAAGYVAIEDLAPGSTVIAQSGSLETVVWVGSMMLYPRQMDLGLPTANLFRVVDGSYGHDRAAPDLLLGPAARILPKRSHDGSPQRLSKPEDIADGMSMVQIFPAAPVRVFHIATSSHCLIRVNGVFAETFHPGGNAHLRMSRELFEIYSALFPHMANLDEFGPLRHQRAA
ncbi:MAG: Hint domain-containing protein [Paracoccaceae bacterium]|nr:Hint domain-containing protein [Paracoccaceae bacterium]